MDYSKEYFLGKLTEKEATPDSIRTAYRQLSREVHPDINPELGDEPMQMLNSAYEAAMKGVNGHTTQREGKGGSYDDVYSYDQGLESFFMDLVSWLYRTEWIDMDDVEVIGSWIWIWNIPKGSQFVKPKADKETEIETLSDERPCWKAADDREIRFMYAKSKKGWYMDLRRFLDEKYDKKRRGSRVTKDDMRTKYGSKTFRKDEKSARTTAIAG